MVLQAITSNRRLFSIPLPDYHSKNLLKDEFYEKHFLKKKEPAGFYDYLKVSMILCHEEVKSLLQYSLFTSLCILFSHNSASLTAFL